MRITLLGYVGFFAMVSCGGGVTPSVVPARLPLASAAVPLSAVSPAPTTVQPASKACAAGHFAAQVTYATGHYPGFVAVA